VEDRLSIIIPVLNEPARINAAIGHLLQLNLTAPCEIIVVDGDRDGPTLQAIKHRGIHKIISRRGRGAQMNAGAQIATGGTLVFLHVDTRMPDDAGDRISRCLEGPGVVVGAFDLGIQSRKRAFRLIEGMVFLRTRLTRIPYGDQAIFVKKDFFETIGGFKDIPLMEDVDLMQRTRRFGGKIAIVPSRVLTSPRRWEEEGIIYCTLRNWTLIVLYRLGVSPEWLAHLYPAGGQ
jgi:rSAM/selenodomain-associated transferase 2